MASLANQKPKDTYEGLLKTIDDAPVGASKKAVVDGSQAPTGLSLSSTKVFANTLQVEAAPSSSTNQSVATFNASGDVEARTANAKVFDTTNSDVIFAKSDGAESSPLVYVSSGDDTADSLVIGSIFSLNSADVVVTGEVGDKYEVSFCGSVQFEQSDAYATFNILQNGTSILTSNFGNTSGVALSKECITMNAATSATTTEETFSITYSTGSGTVNIETGSYLKVQKFS